MNTLDSRFLQYGDTFTQVLPRVGKVAYSLGTGGARTRAFASSASQILEVSQRAKAVSNYLRQTGYIQPGRVLSPSAMGEETVAPGEAAPTGHDSARRVLVRIVTPKTQLTQ